MACSARKASIDPAQIQIVPVWNRCVRRAYLCGSDKHSGRNYEHRRDWARKRLERLASSFAIDCLTYSIMSNHTHQILRNRPDIAQQWNDRTVAIRWLRITPNYDADGNPIEPHEHQNRAIINHPGQVAELRSRLSDISWWMRYFSHYMACRSNREDEVTGHFWESRFGSEVPFSVEQRPHSTSLWAALAFSLSPSRFRPATITPATLTEPAATSRRPVVPRERANS